MMAALIKWRWAAVLSLWALSAGGAYVKGYLDRDETVRIRVVEKQVKLMEKRHEIAKNRPDRGGVVERLRGGSF